MPDTLGFFKKIDYISYNTVFFSLYDPYPIIAMENTFRLVTLQLEFSKWITAITQNEALNIAKIFWDDENITSSTISAICYRNALDKITSQPTANIEWLVQAKVECRKIDRSKVSKKALSSSWEKTESETYQMD